jgi:hypothetical protein
MHLIPIKTVRYENTPAYYLYPAPDESRAQAAPPVLVRKPLPKPPPLFARLMAKLCQPFKKVP